MKTFTIVKTNERDGRTSKQSGSIDELIEAYSYALDVGKSWEHEEGNAKINTNPRGIKSLVKNLNNAINNAAANGWSNYSYAQEV